MAAFVRVSLLDDLPDGSVSRLRLEDSALAIVRRGGEVFALGDRCTHLNVSLSRTPKLKGCRLICWLHGSSFDLRTGEPDQPPATLPLPVHAVELRSEEGGGTAVWVDLQPSAD